MRSTTSSRPRKGQCTTLSFTLGLSFVSILCQMEYMLVDVVEQVYPGGSYQHQELLPVTFPQLSMVQAYKRTVPDQLRTRTENRTWAHPWTHDILSIPGLAATLECRVWMYWYYDRSLWARLVLGNAGRGIRGSDLPFVQLSRKELGLFLIPVTRPWICQYSGSANGRRFVAKKPFRRMHLCLQVNMLTAGCSSTPIMLEIREFGLFELVSSSTYICRRSTGSRRNSSRRSKRVSKELNSLQWSKGWRCSEAYVSSEGWWVLSCPAPHIRRSSITRIDQSRLRAWSRRNGRMSNRVRFDSR